MGSNPAQGTYGFPQKLSSVELPVTFSQFLLNLDCESICDPPGGDTLLAQGIYLTDSIYISKIKRRRCELFSFLVFNMDVLPVRASSALTKSILGIKCKKT